MHKSFIERAGLWACNSLGALLYTLVFAAIVFVPCFLLVDRFPRSWLIRTLRVLGVVSLALVVLLIGALISSGIWDAVVVKASIIAVLFLIGAALGFFRAAGYGSEVATLRPAGDPVAHWSQVLSDHPRWWLRSRAARELGDVAVNTREARAALETCRPNESNRHVRRAVAESLGRLEANG